MSDRKIKIGLIGYGQRGRYLTENVLLAMDVEILAVCDLYEDRAKAGAEYIQSKTGFCPKWTTHHTDVIEMKDIDGIIITSAWESHVKIAVDSMKAGKYTAMEVGGAYSVEDCWSLVRTSEQTGVPCMFLENCCYGRREMMVMQMAEEGVFGDIVHCAGGYCHDLREEIIFGEENRHYRLRNYLRRNCENYPTHELGPIAQILKINRGNRFLSLNSVASCSKGLHEYALQKKGMDSPLAKADFRQGDIVNTVITCAGGETVLLQLDTTLPRYYSRGFTVRGTKGMYEECTDSVFIDGEHNKFDFDWRSNWGNADKFTERYEHPVWREYHKNPMAGHGGIDWLILNVFADCVRKEIAPPIDVYDAAAWMSISALSEESIRGGGINVAVPDFTSGGWLLR